MSQRIMRTELAICIGVILCQSPACRIHIRRELAVLPTWMSAVKKAILQALSYAQMSSFRTVRIVDITNVAMNILPKLDIDDSGVKVFFVSVSIDMYIHTHTCLTPLLVGASCIHCPRKEIWHCYWCDSVFCFRCRCHSSVCCV